MKKSLEDYKEMVVKPQFDWIKIHWNRWCFVCGGRDIVPDGERNYAWNIERI